jgi:uncharacterized membrane protein AbrB (regulator of aidB expression)
MRVLIIQWFTTLMLAVLSACASAQNWHVGILLIAGTIVAAVLLNVGEFA